MGIVGLPAYLAVRVPKSIARPTQTLIFQTAILLCRATVPRLFSFYYPIFCFQYWTRLFRPCLKLFFLYASDISLARRGVNSHSTHSSYSHITGRLHTGTHTPTHTRAHAHTQPYTHGFVNARINIYTVHNNNTYTYAYVCI